MIKCLKFNLDLNNFQVLFFSPDFCVDFSPVCRGFNLKGTRENSKILLKQIKIFGFNFQRTNLKKIQKKKIFLCFDIEFVKLNWIKMDLSLIFHRFNHDSIEINNFIRTWLKYIQKYIFLNSKIFSFVSDSSSVVKLDFLC